MALSVETRIQEIYLILKGRSIDSALTIKEIHDLLINRGYEIDNRTVRRSIESMSIKFGVTSTGSRPERFYLSKDYELRHNLKLDEQSLQVLMIALNNLRSTSHEYFENIVQSCENTILDSLSDDIKQNFIESKNYFYFDYSSSGKPTDGNIKDFQRILQAIKESKSFSCNYLSLLKDTEETAEIVREFEPHLFILSSSIPYLIVKESDGEIFKKLRCARIKNVKITDKIFQRVKKQDFPLKEMFGGWGGIEHQAIEIEIKCYEQMATFFTEKIVHNSQKIEELEEYYKIRINCAVSDELIRLLASFGDEIIDVRPESIKNKVISIWQGGLKSQFEN